MTLELTSSSTNRGVARVAPRPAAHRHARKGGFAALPIAVAVLAAGLVALPILAVVSSVLAPSWENLAHLADTVLPRMVANTLGMVAMVGVGVVVIGTATAWLVATCRFPGSRIFEWLLLLPLAMPAYIIGYAYTDALTFAGPVQTALRETFGWRRGDYWFPDIHSLWGVSLMLTLVLYPYVYILARTAFLQQSARLIDASRMLGHGMGASFRRIALPLARPAIAAGAALALMEALADFGTVQYFGVDTFTTAIYRTWFGMGDRLAAAQLASGLLAVVLLLAALERWSRRQRAMHGDARRAAVAATPIQLKGGAAVLAVAACALPVVLGFALPVAFLIRMQMIGGDPLFGAGFLRYAGNSLTLAAIATMVVMSVALLLGTILRHWRMIGLGGLVRFATLGYAIPGSVIAVGVLVPLGAFDNAVDGVMRAWLGISTGLLLSGTAAALIYAYLVRFLAVGYGAIESGYQRINPRLDDAARILGRTPTGVATTIHVPLLTKSVLTGAVVVFVDVLKELPATLIVRPFDFDTLAVRVYNLASDERLVQASTGSLAIVALGLLPVIVLTRLIRASSRQAPSQRGAKPKAAREAEKLVAAG